MARNQNSNVYGMTPLQIVKENIFPGIIPHQTPLTEEMREAYRIESVERDQKMKELCDF